MSRRHLALAALGVVASATFHTVSHAQLGGLTKKASKAAASAAGVPTGNERYVSKIDMTAAQITAVNQGMAKSIQVGPDIVKKWEKAQEALEKQQAEHDKQMAEYQKKKDAWDKCVENEQNKAQAKLDAANKKRGAAGEKVQNETDTSVIVNQAKAAQAAAERVANGTATAADRQTMADFQKTMAGVRANSAAATGAAQDAAVAEKAVDDSIKARCGPEPQPPSQGSSAGSAGGKAGTAAPTSAADEINQQGAAAAGMTEDEYRKLKEKAMGFAASHTQVKGGDGTSDDDAKAINSALAETSSLMAQASKANVPLT